MGGRGSCLRLCLGAGDDEDAEKVRLLDTHELEAARETIRTQLGEQQRITQEKKQAKEAAQAAYVEVLHATKVGSASVDKASVETCRMVLEAARASYGIAFNGLKDLLSKDAMITTALMAAEDARRRSQLAHIDSELANVLGRYHDLRQDEVKLQTDDVELMAPGTKGDTAVTSEDVELAIQDDPEITRLMERRMQAYLDDTTSTSKPSAPPLQRVTEASHGEGGAPVAREAALALSLFT